MFHSWRTNTNPYFVRSTEVSFWTFEPLQHSNVEGCCNMFIYMPIESYLFLCNYNSIYQLNVKFLLMILFANKFHSSVLWASLTLASGQSPRGSITCLIYTIANMCDKVTLKYNESACKAKDQKRQRKFLIKRVICLYGKAFRVKSRFSFYWSKKKPVIVFGSKC